MSQKGPNRRRTQDVTGKMEGQDKLGGREGGWAEDGDISPRHKNAKQIRWEKGKEEPHAGGGRDEGCMRGSVADDRRRPFINHHWRQCMRQTNGDDEGNPRRKTAAAHAGGGRTEGTRSHSAANTVNCSCINHQWSGIRNSRKTETGMKLS